MAQKFNTLTNYKKYGELLDSGAVFCAFDTETTGLSADVGRVIELGAVKFTKDGVMDTFQTLLDPLMPISPEASAVNHIFDDMVQGMPTESQVMPRFAQFAGGAVLVAHNAQFDIRFVNAAMERLSLPQLGNAAIDTLRLTRAIFPDAGHWTLQALAQRLGIDGGNAHRALDDAQTCRLIFLSTVVHIKKCLR